jgi:hypothetical protein
MIEKWKPHPYSSEYLISSFGRVKSLKYRKERMVKLTNNRKGYLWFHMNNPRERKYSSVHRAVALAFGIINNKDHVNHIDGNKLNNHVSNLEKSNHQHNIAHASRLGLTARGTKKWSAKLTENQVRFIRKHHKPNVRDQKYSTGYFVKKFGVGSSSISDIVKNKKWKHVK